MTAASSRAEQAHRGFAMITAATYWTGYVRWRTTLKIWRMLLFGGDKHNRALVQCPLTMTTGVYLQLWWHQKVWTKQTPTCPCVIGHCCHSREGQTSGWTYPAQYWWQTFYSWHTAYSVLLLYYVLHGRLLMWVKVYTSTGMRVNACIHTQ